MSCFLNYKLPRLTEEMTQENSKTRGWKDEEWGQTAMPRRLGFVIRAMEIN